MPDQRRDAPISEHHLSRVIGLIYDCAIDPDRWPKALEAMGGLIGARMSSIAIYDPKLKTARYASYWGADPNWKHWIKLFEEKYAPMMPFYDAMGNVGVDDVINTADMMQMSGRNDFYETPFYKEWGEPAGLKDVVAAVILSSDTIHCALNIHTPLTADYAGPREIEIVRLLVPHVRRAVLIGDLLDMKALEVGTFKSALELLTTPVVLTDENASVIYANTPAQIMLDARDPVTVDGERLAARSEDATRALRNAIKSAAMEEAHIGAAGFGLPAPFADGRPAVAHVLPLAAPPVRNRLAPSVKAAVFISTTDAAQPPLDALAALFELTKAEKRVVASIIDGRNKAETAQHLGLAESTVKSHLERIFSKTRTRDQAGLAKLAERLSVPVAARPAQKS